MLTPIVTFVLATAAVYWSGTRLPLHGRALAARLGVGAAWLGLFVLSVITSLPELAVTLSAMLGQGAPNLALGNILGSNNFNLTAIVLLEMSFAGGMFLRATDARRYSRTALLLLVFTSLVGGAVLWAGGMRTPLPLFVFSLPIVAVFVVDFAGGGRGVVLDEARLPTHDRGRPPRDGVAFALLAAAVIAGGYLVARSAEEIALFEFGTAEGPRRLGETFVGTLFVAIATSLPEVSVALGAVRHTCSPDVALGTLMGSNSINILIFALGAPLLMMRGTGESAWRMISVESAVRHAHLVNVAVAILLTMIVSIGMRSRGGRGSARALVLLMLPVYLVGLYLVYRLGAA